MTRARVLIIYSLLIGTCGWVWLLTTLPGAQLALSGLLLFGTLALLIDILGFRIPPDDPHSLVGPVLIAGALALGPQAGALVAAGEGLLFGMLLPVVSGHQRTFLNLLARPVLRSGTRAAAILLGDMLARWMSGGPPTPGVLAIALIGTYLVGLPLVRILRELIQDGRNGLFIWWRTAWRPALTAELAPLPMAVLLAEVYTRLGNGYFLLAGAALAGASLALRQGAQSLISQRRSVRELEQLNQVSRAIIRNELDVDALCELIYRETSKVVDTSSFHLGLFEDDTYTLKVRVADRVRLPPLSVRLEAGDGLVGWMRETGRAILVNDFATEMDELPARPRYQSTHPPRSGVYVPLTVGEEVIGSISIQSYRPHTFDLDDLRLLSLIADQAAVAISKARAYRKAQRRAIQLQTIHEVSEQVTAILDLNQLLPSVVHLISAYTRYHPVHIFTLEPDGALTFRASTADEAARNRLQARPLRLGDGLIGSAAATGKLVVVGDVRADARYIPDSNETRAEIAVPLIIGTEVIGVLDLQSTEEDAFDEDEQFMIQTLADQIAVALDSARSYTAQQEEAWTLNALLQVVENIARAATLPELLSTSVRLPPLLVGSTWCLFLLHEREQDAFVILAAYGLTQAQRSQLLGLRIPPHEAALLEQVRRDVQPVELAVPGQLAEQLPAVAGALELEQGLALPLASRGTPLGVLLLDLPVPPQARQLTICTGIASQAAVALESMLLEAEAAEAARLEQELRVAREIQTALLPAVEPQIAGWDLAADWRSARQVGGDFYDFWQLIARPAGSQRGPAEPGAVRLGFVIADVSDKGVPAAMFMALSRSLLRAAALDGSAPAVALTRANRWITRDSESGMFVTMFYGVLDSLTGELHYTSAGHNPPLLLRVDGRWETLGTPGIALGVLEEAPLGEARVTIAPGDVLVCYTDGVTEAIDEFEEPFGVERLQQVVAEHATGGARAVLSAIVEAVSRYTSNKPPFDDITLVVIARQA